MSIEICPYNADWPRQFDELATALAGALGPLASSIDHIGSTAVPGLGAKDRIDIQVTVGGEDSFPAVKTALEGLGYTQAEHTCDHIPFLVVTAPGDLPPTNTDPQWQKRFFRPPAGQRPTNLHVRIEGRANQRYPLLFRDYLRAHPQAAAAYENLKRQLAFRFPDNIDAYCDTKDPACDLIIIAAEAWALNSGWTVTSSPR